MKEKDVIRWFLSLLRRERAEMEVDRGVKMRNYHNIKKYRILSIIIAVIMCMTMMTLNTWEASATETSNAAEGIRYDYDIFVINKYEKLYTNCNVLLYVKTDNPDPSTIRLDYHMKGLQKISDATSTSHLEYDDVEVLNPGKAARMAVVDGGYLYKAKIASEGKLTVTVWENDYNTDESVSVMLYDHETAYMEWAEEMLEKHTDDSMTGPEKMGAMCEFIEENFTYFPQLNVGEVSVGGVEAERQLLFTFNEGSPYMDSKVGHCWHFADLMVTFGKLAGYDGYRKNADYLMHQYAVIIIGNEEYWYDPYVPVESGNYTDEDLAAVEKVDFSKYVDESDHVEIGSTYQKKSKGISMVYDDVAINIDEEKFSYDNGVLKGVTLTYYDRVLEEGEDYTLDLRVSEIDGGKAISMSFHGINDFRDIGYANRIEYTNPIDISDVTISIDRRVYEYDGTEKKPNVRVKRKRMNEEGEVEYIWLYEDHDFTVSYEDNINPGTAKVIINGMNAYKGTATKTFTIEKEEEWKPLDIAKHFGIMLSETTYTYDGSVIKPNVIVGGTRPGIRTLERGTDYTVSYQNNEGKSIASAKYPGTYKVIAKGKGNYTGTLTSSFTIKAPSVAAPKSVSVRLEKRDYDAVYASWSKVAVKGAAVKYKVQYKVGNGSWKTATEGTTKTSCTIKALADGKKVSVKVTPYAVINGKTYNGSTKTSAGVYTLKKLSKPKVKKASKTKIKVTWDNINGETGYQIYKSDKKNKGFELAKTVKSTKAKSTAIKAVKNKKYYYKVRAYKNIKIGSKTYKVYGPWSAVKSYKLK